MTEQCELASGNLHSLVNHEPVCISNNYSSTKIVTRMFFKPVLVVFITVEPGAVTFDRPAAVDSASSSTTMTLSLKLSVRAYTSLVSIVPLPSSKTQERIIWQWCD